MMNNFNILPWWGDLLVILAILGFTTITGIRKKAATYYGFAGFLIVAPLASLTWFTRLSTWWALPVIVVAGVLFFIGLFQPKDKDDNLWHFLALISALSGKALIAGIIATWGMQVPLLVALLLSFLIVGLIVAIVRLMRSPRVEKAMSEKFDQEQPPATEPEAAAPNTPEPAPAN